MLINPFENQVDGSCDIECRDVLVLAEIFVLFVLLGVPRFEDY